MKKKYTISKYKLTSVKKYVVYGKKKLSQYLLTRMGCQSNFVHSLVNTNKLVEKNKNNSFAINNASKRIPQNPFDRQPRRVRLI